LNNEDRLRGLAEGDAAWEPKDAAEGLNMAAAQAYLRGSFSHLDPFSVAAIRSTKLTGRSERHATKTMSASSVKVVLGAERSTKKHGFCRPGAAFESSRPAC